MNHRLPNSVFRTLQALLLLVSLVYFGLHFAHLTADFPNHSPWMDWSKYTDEGWYGDAAIRHFQRGHWYVPGDFNPAAALPVWPLLEGIVFRFTGVSLVAARALTVSVFGGILLASWILLRRWTRTRVPGSHSLAPEAAVLLLALSPFCFVFTRLAILEPLLVLLTLLALLAAGAVRPYAPVQPGTATPRLFRANLRPILTLGILLVAMVLTKTTALFLVPAVAWLLFATLEYRPRLFFRVALPAAGLALALWLAYFGLVVRPFYLLDYRYLFSANAYTGITRANAVSVLQDTFKDGMWMGKFLFPIAVVALAVVAVRWRRLRDYPLIPTLILWAGGYVAFLAYHDNLQPRYYLVVALPLTLLVPVVADQLLLTPLRTRAAASPVPYRIGLVVAAAVLAFVTLPDARITLGYVRHPEYTLVHAASEIHGYIARDLREDPSHSPLVLSISGSDLSLMTGLPSICDDFGTLELADRVKRYRPGWYIAWNQIDDDKMDALTPLFHVERVASFPAMDDPDRNLMILYRLDASEPSRPKNRKRKPTPRPLQTKVGQQPSTAQLVH